MNGQLTGHLAACESCRFLVEGGAGVVQALAGASTAAAPPAADLADMEAALRQDLAAERGPLGALRSRSRPARTLLFAAAAGAVALAYFLFLRRADFDAYPPWRMLLVTGSYAALALGLAWAALRPLHAQPLSPAALVALGLAAPIVFALLPELPSPHFASYRPLVSAYKCFTIGAAVSAGIFLVARALHRGGAAFTIPAAVAAGLIGVLTGQLECPTNFPHHLLLGHATIPFALVLATMVSRRFAAG